MEILGLLLILGLVFLTWFPPETYQEYFRRTTANESAYTFTIWSMKISSIGLLVLYVIAVFLS